MLEVIDEEKDYVVPKTGVRARRVICRCECGKEKDYLLANVIYGKTKGCGCVKASRGFSLNKDTRVFSYMGNTFVNLSSFSMDQIRKMKI